MLLVGCFSQANTVIDTLKITTTSPFLILEECDACSSSASGGGAGFGTLLYTNFVGFRYLYQDYATKSGSFGNSPWTQDIFNATTVQGRFGLFDKVSVSAQFSYHNNHRQLTTLKQVNANQAISGIGDGVVLGFYTPFNTMTADSLTIKQKLNTGLGVKIPLGEFTTANTSGNNPAFQLGTGSWDYILALEYVIQKDHLGVNALLNYTYKTENKEGYQFGNQLNYGATLFYAFDALKVQVYPQVGIQGEQYQTNRLKEAEITNTSGDVVFGKIGLETTYQRWSLGFNYLTPIKQNLMADNLIANKRFSVQLNFSL